MVEAVIFKFGDMVVAAIAIFAGITLLYIVYQVLRNLGKLAGGAIGQQRQEALFKASFPDLQPHFHPAKVLPFVSAWQSRKPNSDTTTWKNPPGFGLPGARLSPMSEKGQMTELLDAAGAAVASFLMQKHPEGGVLRIGPGKITVNVRDKAVRYWHPQREFKWSKLKGWRMVTALSDRGIDANDRGMDVSSDSSSSSTATTAAAAVAGAAVVAGAGGAFDGGGSSSSWDGGSESRTSY
jgi:hypothetical protein